jgi:hypothetical protein
VLADGGDWVGLGFRIFNTTYPVTRKGTPTCEICPCPLEQGEAVGFMRNEDDRIVFLH